MFIMPMLIAAENASQRDRVHRLEHALVLTLQTLQSVVERLESKFGSEFLGADLKHLTGGGTDAELQDVLDQIESSLADGKQPMAARQFREAFGCTWDQTHQTIRQWKHYSREQKRRWLRLARFIKALEHVESGQAVSEE